MSPSRAKTAEAAVARASTRARGERFRGLFVAQPRRQEPRSRVTVHHPGRVLLLRRSPEACFHSKVHAAAVAAPTNRRGALAVQGRPLHDPFDSKRRRPGRRRRRRGRAHQCRHPDAQCLSHLSLKNRIFSHRPPPKPPPSCGVGRGAASRPHSRPKRSVDNSIDQSEGYRQKSQEIRMPTGNRTHRNARASTSPSCGSHGASMPLRKNLSAAPLRQPGFTLPPRTAAFSRRVGTCPPGRGRARRGLFRPGVRCIEGPLGRERAHTVKVVLHVARAADRDHRGGAFPASVRLACRVLAEVPGRLCNTAVARPTE